VVLISCAPADAVSGAVFAPVAVSARSLRDVAGGAALTAAMTLLRTAASLAAGAAIARLSEVAAAAVISCLPDVAAPAEAFLLLLIAMSLRDFAAGPALTAAMMLSRTAGSLAAGAAISKLSAVGFDCAIATVVAADRAKATTLIVFIIILSIGYQPPAISSGHGIKTGPAYVGAPRGLSACFPGSIISCHEEGRFS